MSKDFKDFVTAIGECKSKQEEDRIIMKEMCAPIPPLCVERFACEQRGGGVALRGPGRGACGWGCAA